MTSRTEDTHAGTGPARSILERGTAFYAVGALGLGVQLAALWLLTARVGVPYLAATAVAVEVTILHNFWWHERWTWRDRTGSAGARLGGAALARLARFHAANGLISLWGNVALTGACVTLLGTGYLAGNLIAVVVCSLVNFAAADRFVYRDGPRDRSPACALAGGLRWARCGKNAGGR